MRRKREPSRPTLLGYRPTLGGRTASCSMILKREPSQRRTRKWKAFPNDRIRPPQLASLKHALSNVFLISS
jgi:hypothetical protein